MRLVTVQTLDTRAVQAGGDAGKIKKNFGLREDLIGEVIEIEGDNYTPFRFTRAWVCSQRVSRERVSVTSICPGATYRAPA